MQTQHLSVQCLTVVGKDTQRRKGDAEKNAAQSGDFDAFHVVTLLFAGKYTQSKGKYAKRLYFREENVVK